jgi:hypothetical protein
MTSIHRWPVRRPHPETCRHCGETFVTADGAKYCPRPPCQDAKRRRSHPRERRRG